MNILIGSNMSNGLNKIINMIDDFSNQRDWSQFHSPKNLAVSISIEANELLECFQWTDLSVKAVNDDAELRQKIQDELADVLIYALRSCSVLGFDPLEVINKKLRVNEQKYPVHLSKGTSSKYDKLSPNDVK